MKPLWMILLSVAVLSGACDRGNETDPGAVDEQPAAAGVEIADITLGRAIGPDKAVTEETAAFAPGDTIYVSVRTGGSAPSATLGARWTFEDGQVVDESSQTIAPTGPAVTEFHVSHPDGWPAGSYEVAISLDGQPAETRTFTVEGE